MQPLSRLLLACGLALAAASPTFAQRTAADAERDVRRGVRPSTVTEELAAAQGDLLRLPPLADLLEIAMHDTPQARKIRAAQQQEVVREKLWKLGNWDLLSLQAVAIAGRRDVFAINSDGSVFVPTASVVDNMNTQASLSLKVNPVSFLQNGKQAQIIAIERDRLDAELEILERTVAESVIYAYNMAKKALEMMDARAEAVRAVEARGELSERLFRQGAMSLADYAEFQSKSADMAAKFQDSRGDFRLYYQMLMERVYGEIP